MICVDCVTLGSSNLKIRNPNTMFTRQYLIVFVAYWALVAHSQALEDVKTTSTVAPATIEEIVMPSVAKTTASPTTEAPAVTVTVQVADMLNGTQEPALTLVVNSTKAPTQVDQVASKTTTNTTPDTTTKPLADINDKVNDKLSQYFAPICDSVNKLMTKQLSKIQSQMKRFADMTGGEMRVCFMQNYAFDPILQPVTKAQLTTICASRMLDPKAKGSFKMFKDCSAGNWNQNIDNELDRITTARLNCAKNHNHSKNDTTITLMHDTTNEDDEISLIGDVVSKVFDGAEEIVNKPDIKVIDMSNPSPSSVTTTPKPLNIAIITLTPTNSSNQSSTEMPSTTLSPNSKRLLNNPNTVLVFVDESGARTTAVPNKPMMTFNTTVRPIAMIEPIIGTSNTTLVPVTIVEKLKKASNSSLAGKILPIVNDSTIAPATSNKTESTTIAALASPALAMTTTSKPATTLAPTVGPKTTAKTIVSLVMPKLVTTAAPRVAQKLTTQTPAIPTNSMANLTESSITFKPSEKPLETLQEMLKRQEKEKQDFETRLRIEREKLMKQLQKKQDEIDAKNAIKALQYQRAASNQLGANGHSSHSDARMHQIEHERQMTIDPIGHTMKHQLYEQNKQQKLMAVKQ